MLVPREPPLVDKAPSARALWLRPIRPHHHVGDFVPWRTYSYLHRCVYFFLHIVMVLAIKILKIWKTFRKQIWKQLILLPLRHRAQELKADCCDLYLLEPKERHLFNHFKGISGSLRSVTWDWVHSLGVRGSEEEAMTVTCLKGFHRELPCV